MINKQSVWFVTLFSLILVLSIYYVTMSDNSLKGILENNSIDENTKNVNATVSDSSLLVSLRVSDDESVLKEMEDLQSILLDTKKTSTEKNDAYNSLVKLQEKKALEEKIEKKIKDDYSLESFAKIKDDTVSITVVKSDHTANIANSIIRLANEIVGNDIYVTVKFQST